MSRILIVLAPLFLFGVWALFRMALGRPLGRRAFNVFESLLLMVYFAITVGLGVFWVANQQLPVFDWHYLFGYATTLLVLVHLLINWRVVTAYLRSRGSRHSGAAAPAKPSGGALAPMLGIMALLAIGYYLGQRYSDAGLPAPSITVPTRSATVGRSGASPADVQAREVVEQYHEFSSHDRAEVFRRAPGVEWGPSPPPFMSYPEAPSTPLPAARERVPGAYTVTDAILRDCPPSVPDGLDLQSLADILFYAVGVTDRSGGIALRASPSSGALFPTELYVHAERVDGLESGLYYYHPDSHALLKLSQSRATEVAAIAPGAVRAPATIFLASIFRRTGYKYRDRAYRYAVADAGHALENLLVAATSAGFQSQPLPQFDDADAVHLLGLDPADEGVLAIIPAFGPCGQVVGDSGGTGDDDHPVTTTLGVTGLVHTATSLELEQSDIKSSPGEANQRPLPASAIHLPSPTAAPADPLVTMRSRRSIRRYTEEPLTLTELSSFLHSARRAPTQLTDAVQVHVVTHAVDGLEPGSYRYHPAHHALTLTTSGERRAQAAAAALNQDVIGDGAAVFVLTLDREETFATYGARGYRQGFLEAGMIGERLYLEAVGRRLGACAVGAFYDLEAAELIGIDPAKEWVAHFCAVGRPER